MSLLALLKGRRGATGFGHASTAEEVCAGLDLSDKTILITGINSGLGYESGRVLSVCGAHIIGAARSLEKAEGACADFVGRCTPVACELSEPDSIHVCVELLKKRAQSIDVLLCNAGIMALPRLQQSHGIELQFFTNHIGHFILVTGLLDLLSQDGRVVMLSSRGHKFAPEGGIQFDNLSGERGYRGLRAYGQSKLANILFAKALARRFEGTNRVANAVHPGAIATNLGRHMNQSAAVLLPLMNALFLKSPGQGAATQCYVAAHPEAGKVNGEYFADCNIAPASTYSRDAELAERLWLVSIDIARRFA
jgi:WW domain-containing oxidoreductase